MDTILYLIIGLALGFAIAWLISKGKQATISKNLELKLIDNEKITNNAIHEIEKQKQYESQRAEQLLSDKKALENLLNEERKNSLELTQLYSGNLKELEYLNEKLTIQKQEMLQLQDRFKQEFENLANAILKKNTIDFIESNQKNISEILTPLKEKIVTFESKITESYEKSLRDTSGLREELKILKDLNHKISEEAHNLTTALKGDVKKQGNWGEIILERVLERSGLTKGREYEIQNTFRDDEGNMLRPDVIVHLPDGKHIIVDSKVSLVAYEQYCNTDVISEKDQLLKLHIDSIKNHIKGLSEKNYSSLKSLNSPDFVLLFMPIESSFSLAIQSEIELFNFAWDKKIVIVSPTTLLATLRTISSIWKQERQVQNAQEIAKQGAALYDKFEGFLKDFEKMETHMKLLNTDYEEAKKKLTTGRGNVISQAEKLKNLGIQPSKQISKNLLDLSETDED